MKQCVICNELVDDDKLICPKHDAVFRYQFLDRLRCDCEFFLGYGERRVGVLWAHNVKRHIQLMKEVYNSFSETEKPEWLSYEEILEYEAVMLNDGVGLKERNVERK